jgi:hypothetical protein
MDPALWIGPKQAAVQNQSPTGIIRFSGTNSAHAVLPFKNT